MRLNTLNKIILQLENTASHDETRFHINCVEVTKSAIVSTDGHVLAKVEHEDESLSRLDKAYVHREKLPYLKAVAKLYKNALEVSSVVNESGIYLDEKLITEKDDVRYPNWQQFVPSYSESVSIGLDADLLMSLVTAIKEGKKTNCKLTFQLNREVNKDGKELSVKLNTVSPIHVWTSEKSIGVLMPCRI